MKKKVLLIFIFSIFSNLLFGYEAEVEKKSFNDFISKDQLDKARDFLKEKKIILGKKLLQKHYIRLGRAFLKNEKNIEALNCYMNVPDKKKKIKKIIKRLAKLIGEDYLVKGNYKKSLEYYKISEDWEKIRKLSYVKSGEKSLSNGMFEQALDLFRKSGFIERIAWCYGVMAADYKKKGEVQLAKSFYKKAIDKYESILKSFEYIWCDEYNKHRLQYMSEFNSFEQSSKEQEKEIMLKKILMEVGNYCIKLKDESIYFFCEEHVIETIDFSVFLENPNTNSYSIYKKTGRKNNIFVYSYQLIQEDNIIRETRKLLRYMGRKKNRIKKNEWETKTVILKKLIFGPSGMFGFYWQFHNDYKIIGNDIINNDKAIIIECIPKDPFKKENFLFGKAWVKVDDFSILKIEWEPKAIGFNNNFIKISRSLSKKPHLAWNIEYLLKRNGIRYPTKCYYEESFVNKSGKKSTSLTLKVKFKNHKFFDVGTETDITPVDIDQID